MTNHTETARKILAEDAVPGLLKAADAAVKAGTHEWTVDPHHGSVVGLVQRDSNRADVIVYLDDRDFEVSDEFEDRF